MFEHKSDGERAMATRHPDELTIAQRKDSHGDRAFVAWLRNGYGQSRPIAPIAAGELATRLAELDDSG